MSDCSLPQLSLLYLSLVRGGCINFHVFLEFFLLREYFLRINSIWDINFMSGQDRKDPLKHFVTLHLL